MSIIALSGSPSPSFPRGGLLICSSPREREIIREGMRELAGRLSQQEMETHTVKRLQENEVWDLHKRISDVMGVLQQSISQVSRKLGGIAEVLKERLLGYLDFPQDLLEQVNQETTMNGPEARPEEAGEKGKQTTKRMRREEGAPHKTEEKGEGEGREGGDEQRTGETGAHPDPEE
ncbi:hypothetical protein BDZ91DRAFT_800697 [Kalaharituber pfeilii]|nr:hypothetical protein BDZ91DRAFT_800697 [Kalaharituber pfeilii]